MSELRVAFKPTEGATEPTAVSETPPPVARTPTEDERKKIFDIRSAHPFFDQKRIKGYEAYRVIPSNVDWTSQESIVEHFPPVKGLGGRQIPLQLFAGVDMEHPQDRIAIVNWWRSMTSQEQTDARKEIYRVYPKTSRAKKKAPGTAGAPEIQEVSLQESHPFFGTSIKCRPLYASVHLHTSWDDSKWVQETFPPYKGFGAAQIPLGPLLDVRNSDSQDKLAIVNWWRSMTPKEQADAPDNLKGVYETYTKSNNKVSNENQLALRDELAANPETKAVADSIHRWQTDHRHGRWRLKRSILRTELDDTIDAKLD